jgi:hypothetical protein
MSSNRFTKLLDWFMITGPPLICGYTSYKYYLYTEKRDHQRLLLERQKNFRFKKNLIELNK